MLFCLKLTGEVGIVEIRPLCGIDDLEIIFFEGMSEEVIKEFTPI